MIDKNIDFASLLLYGEEHTCNGRCEFCIGKDQYFKDLEPNMDTMSSQLDVFCDLINAYKIKEVSISGINVEPTLHPDLASMFYYIRANSPDATIALHTNGGIEDHTELFNMFDKITLSYPSWDIRIYEEVMGVPPENLEWINELHVPVKLSMIITKETATFKHLADYIANAWRFGYNRIVMRRLWNRHQIYLPIMPFLQYKKHHCNNPVYEWKGLEITIWNYHDSTVKGLYLFPDGSIRDKFIE